MISNARTRKGLLVYESRFGFQPFHREIHCANDKRRISQRQAVEKYFPQAEPASEEDMRCIEERQHFGPLHSEMLVNKQRCKHGFPQAIVLNPVNRVGKISSGSLRLTCPHLVKAVDALEADGGIDQLNEELRSNPALQEDFTRTNNVWRNARFDMMDASAFEHVKAALGDHIQTFMDSGILGVAPGQVDDVKCLHAHLADHLVRGRSMIGERVKSMLAERGVSVDGNLECWQQCDRRCDATQATWWYTPTKNKFKFMRRKLRKDNADTIFVRDGDIGVAAEQR